jgi:hypothetical protein
MPSTPPLYAPASMNGHFIGRQKRADPCLAPTGSGVANGEAPLIGALRKICPRRSAIMVRANQNSPDSPATGHRPSRLGNRCAGKTLPAWLRSRVRSRLAAPSWMRRDRAGSWWSGMPRRCLGVSAPGPSVTSSWDDTQHQTRRGPNVPTHAMTSAPTLRHHKRQCSATRDTIRT